MSKVNVQNKVIIEELDKIRGRLVSTETQDVNLEQKIHDLLTQTNIQDTQLSNLEKWSGVIQKQLDIESIELTKIRDITD